MSGWCGRSAPGLGRCQCGDPANHAPGGKYADPPGRQVAEPVNLTKQSWLVVRREAGIPTHIRSALDGRALPVAVNLRAWPGSGAPLVWRLVRRAAA